MRGDFYQQMDSYRSQRETAMLLGSSARVSDAEAETPWPCKVGPYREVRKNCAREAHHIVPDMALRYGTRAEGMRGQNRIPNAPSFQDGIAIA